MVETNQLNESVNQRSEMEWDIDNLPNRLTLFRILLVPIIVFSLFLNLFNYEWLIGHHKALGYLAGITFIIAGFTDFLDGYIARKRKIVTVFGSFLDPIADKFLVISSLIMLLALDRINVLLVVILVLRELYITALRLLANEEGLKIPVDNFGKWKTALQMAAIPMLMFYDNPSNFPLTTIGHILIYAASIISIWSALKYSFGLVKKIRSLRGKKPEKSKKDIRNAEK